MVKQEITICDNCKERKAKRKCCICGIDLCLNCGANISVIMQDISVIGRIGLCKKHSNSLNKMVEKKKSGEWLFDFTNEIEDKIRKELVCENLGDKNAD